MFVLGIDLGKDNLYVHLLETGAPGPPTAKGQVRVFPNSHAGHQSLQDWLSVEQALPQLTSVVMEATGVYWERVAVALHTAQFAVSVVNAAQIKFFAQSTLRRGKTDTMDAEIILRLASNLRALRQARGLSQMALADLSGLHYTYVSGIERGERNLSIDNVGRLADALGLDATDLLRPDLTKAGGLTGIS